MENYDFIESGIIFGLTDRSAFRKFRYTAKDFATHGDAFRFLTQYFDDYGHSPSNETLMANYPTLNDAAANLDLQYAVNTFQNQVLPLTASPPVVPSASSTFNLLLPPT